MSSKAKNLSKLSAVLAEGGTLTASTTAPTAALGTSTNQLATTAFVGNALNGLINAAPTTLDTLNELAAALGNDSNFATTVTNTLALKAPLASPTFTGTLAVPLLNATGGIKLGDYQNINATTNSTGISLSGGNAANSGGQINLRGASFTSNPGGIEFVSNGTPVAKIDSAGRVTMPYQPFAQASSNTAASGKIPLNAYVGQRGGLSVDTTNARMNIPVSGAYVIGYHHLGNQGSGACQVVIRLNGTDVGGSRIQDSDSTNDNFGTQIIRTLAAGDYIEFWTIQGATHGNPDYNSMYAYLIG